MQAEGASCEIHTPLLEEDIASFYDRTIDSGIAHKKAFSRL